MKRFFDIYKKFFFTLVMLFALVSFGTLINSTEVYGNVPAEVGSETYFDNYQWLLMVQKWRDKNVVIKRSDSTVMTEVNKKYITSGDNATSVNQSVGYSYTARVGHQISAKVKTKIKVFELEAGYTFSTEVSQTYSATLNIPPKSMIVLYTYDKRVRNTRLTVDKTQQQYYLKNWVLGWHDDGYIGQSIEYVYEFDGVTFLFVQA